MGDRSPQHGSAAVRHGRVDPSGLCSVTTAGGEVRPTSTLLENRAQGRLGLLDVADLEQ